MFGESGRKSLEEHPCFGCILDEEYWVLSGYEWSIDF